MYSRASDARKENDHSDLEFQAAPNDPHPGQPTFRTGDRVMVPPYGIGTVCEISWRKVAGELTAYYGIEFPQTSSRAFVPIAAPQGSAMRAALTSQEMPRLLNHLKNGKLDLPPQWSARQRQVTEILVSGDPFDLAVLTCELRRWNLSRGLPDLDRQAFRRAIKLLEQEVQGLEDGQAHQVRQLLGSALSEGAQ
jgi:CarD family transcriptional regulator